MTSVNSNYREIKVVTSRLKRLRTLKVEEDTITTPHQAKKLFSKQLKDMDREVFAMFCLDSKGHITHYSEIHMGTLNQSLIHPREIFKVAILANSHAIILAHNHPSGDLTPSQNDILTTEELIKAGKIMKIDVLDHIIVGNDDLWSMRNKNSELFEVNR